MYTLQGRLFQGLNNGAGLSPDMAPLMAGVAVASSIPVTMFLVGRQLLDWSIAASGVKGSAAGSRAS